MKKIILLFLLLNFSFFSYCLVDQSADVSIGNKYYSKQSFYISHTFEFGVSGVKDYFSEYFLFSYSFKSKNLHRFSIRNFHLGYTNGLFSNKFKFFNFAIMAGFEYCYKIFSNTDGFYVFFDAGGCNNGFAFNTGLGVGSRTDTGFELNLTYLYNVGFFSRMDFYFLIAKVFIIRGKIGLDLTHYNLKIELFTFIAGLYIGFSIKKYFRLEAGGGLTINDYAYYSGFGSFNLAFQF